MDNPFERIYSYIDRLERRVIDYAEQLRRIEEKISRPTCEYQTLSEAARQRHRSPKKIMALVRSGEIRMRQEVGRGGKPVYYLSCADLDRLVPTLSTKTPSGDPLGADRATHPTKATHTTAAYPGATA